MGVGGTKAYLVKALRESSSDDADEADTDETGGCSAENLFKLVALGRKESGKTTQRRATPRSVAADTTLCHRISSASAVTGATGGEWKGKAGPA